MSLLFGLSGVVDYTGIAKGAGSSPAALVGGVMIIAGFAFKLAVPPFHMWAPDVYESSPVPVTAMLAMGSKAAGFAALIRVLISVFPPSGFAWITLLLALAAAAMLIGNLAAIPQTNLKRLLAYSSVAQAGYMLTGLLALNVAGVKSVMIYAILYVFANVGAFAVITAVNNHRGGETIDDFSGLSKQSPLLAAVMTVSLLSMAGIPPLAGFAGKFFLFTAAIDAGYLWIAVLGFVLSMVSVYYYLLIVKSMYSGEVIVDQPFLVGDSLRLTALFAAAATVFWGVYPGPLARLAETAAQTLFR
jgi:NADH-quinone oxidoreductase subunit N